MKSIFVSYKSEDRAGMAQLEQWEADSLLGQLKIKGGTGELAGRGLEEVEAYLKPELEGTEAMLVLVGDECHNCQMMNHEVKIAQKYSKKIVPVRVPGTTGAPPSAIRQMPVIEFSPEKIVGQL